VYVVDLPNTFNSIVFATRQPTTPENLLENARALQDNPAAHPLLRAVTASAYGNLKPVEAGGQIYTDDLAPIEWVTNNMIINYLLGGDLGALE
jgi:hypothetical protein